MADQDSKPAIQVKLLLAAAVLINLFIFSHELFFPVRAINDGLLHVHQIERMDQAWENGEHLIDHWDDSVGTGYPFLRTYSCLSHLMVWATYRLTGRTIPIPTLYQWFVLLFWLAWPLVFFFTLRLLEIDPLPAALAAWICPFAHTVFRFGIDIETFGWMGYGFLPNLVGLVFFSLALGLGVKFLKTGRQFGWAVLSQVLALMGHLVMGYAAAISLCVCAGVSMVSERGKMKTLLRLFGLGFAAFGGSLFFLFPYATDRHFINRSTLEAISYWDSYGFVAAMKSLVTGTFLDYHVTVPVISIFFFLGLFKSLRRPKSNDLLLVLFLFWFIAFLGRSAWNPMVYLLPLNGNIPFERFLIPAQFFAIALAGSGLCWVMGFLRKGRHIVVYRWGVLVLPILLLGFHVGKNVEQGLFRTLDAKKATKWALKIIEEEFDPFAAILSTQNRPRLLVPQDGDVRLGPIPFFAIPMIQGLPHIGFLWHSMSLNSDFLYQSDWNDPKVAQLWGVTYAIGPPDRLPASGFRTLKKEQWIEIGTANCFSGLFSSGIITRFLPGFPDDHRDAIQTWMASEDPKRGHYLGLSITKTMEPLQEAGEDIPGLIDRNIVLGYEQKRGRPFGFVVRVRYQEKGLLIARMTYHPGWHATVDGAPVSTLMVSPSILAIPVDSGTHRIELDFRASPWWSRFLAVSITLFSLFLLTWMRSIWGRNLGDRGQD